MDDAGSGPAAVAAAASRGLEALRRGLGRAVPALAKARAFVLEVLRKYHRDDCISYAASISFFLIISLIPLTTLFFKLMGLMLGNAAYGLGLQRTIAEIYPYLPRGFIADCIQNSRKVGGLGSSWVVLIIGAHWGVNQLDNSLTHIFGLRMRAHRQTRRFPLVRRLVVEMGLLVGLVALLATLFNWALLSRSPMGSLRVLHWLPPVLGLILATLVLEHLPRRHVQFRHAFLGGAVCSVLWGTARVAFGYYLKYTPTWGILYGSLSGFMAALVFLYYSCAIFMLGAEVTAAFYLKDVTGAHKTVKQAE